MILAATGHRPEKLGGHGSHTDARLRELARVFIDAAGPSSVISGMALGWDMAWAEAALELGVPLIAAVPFVEQPSRWPSESQDRYFEICSMATQIATVCPPGFSPRKMQLRNEWMVDRCDVLVALWDGSMGGTGNCLRYARRKRCETINLWDAWA